jgi:hypothetical protein
MDRISPGVLRLVVIALAACGAVGLWMGMSDSLRRTTPTWEGGDNSMPAAVAGPPDATPFDPKAKSPVVVPAASAAPAAKSAAAKPAGVTEAPTPLNIPPAPAATTAPTPAQTADKAAAKTATAPAQTADKAAAKTATARPPTPPKTQTSDPIGDLVQEKTAQPQPDVPF